MWRGGNHHGGSRHRLVGLNTNRLAVLGLVAGDGGDGGVLEDFQLRHDVGEELVLRGTGSWCEARNVHVTGEERAQNTEANKKNINSIIFPLRNTLVPSQPITHVLVSVIKMRLDVFEHSSVESGNAPLLLRDRTLQHVQTTVVSERPSLPSQRVLHDDVEHPEEAARVAILGEGGEAGAPVSHALDRHVGEGGANERIEPHPHRLHALEVPVLASSHKRRHNLGRQTVSVLVLLTTRLTNHRLQVRAHLLQEGRVVIAEESLNTTE